MILVESLINDLQKEIARLQGELEQAHKDIKDFENLAREWKKGYQEEVRALKARIIERNQVIDSLQEELEERLLVDHTDES